MVNRASSKLPNKPCMFPFFLKTHIFINWGGGDVRKQQQQKGFSLEKYFKKLFFSRKDF